MLAGMTAREFERWKRFDLEEPIGPRESRQQMALMLAMLANRWRPKNAPKVDPEEFLIHLAEEVEQAKLSHMINTLRAIARPAAERPRHRKHPRSEKAAAKALKQQRKRAT